MRLYDSTVRREPERLLIHRGRLGCEVVALMSHSGGRRKQQHHFITKYRGLLRELANV
jgi:hypothetical protein